MPRLVIVEGPDRGAVFEFDADSVTIGRSSSNPVRLNYTEVSRVHARLDRREDGFHISDAESSNGIFVNGQKVHDRRLAPGDQISIALTTFVFEPQFVMSAARDDAGAVILIDDPSEKPSAKGELTSRIEEPVPDKKRAMLTPEMAALEELQSAHGRLETVYKATAIAASTLDEQELCARLMELALKEFDAERAAVIFAGPGGIPRVGTVKAKDGKPSNITLSRTVLKSVLEKGAAVFSDDIATDPRFSSSHSLFFGNIRSFVCAPMRGKSGVIGAVYIDSTDLLRQFGSGDRDLLENIAGQAGIAIENARLFARTRDEAIQLRKIVAEDTTFVGSSPKLKSMIAEAEKAAKSEAGVLLTGETGSGKELAAMFIHMNGPRRGKPFVPVDCSAIPEQLLESELFGHEKGAFTGAIKSKLGMFESADGGTLFMDEIGNANLHVQSKLLRFLEDRTFIKVGGAKVIRADVRIVSATNADLEKMVKAGSFREDLYYRLAVIPIEVPPLRERAGDVPELLAHFMNASATKLGRRPPAISGRAMKTLMKHKWPGNIRELRNAAEYIMVLCSKPEADLEDLPQFVTGRAKDADAAGLADLNLEEAVIHAEKGLITAALARANGVKSEAAKLLAISRPTLDKKMREYGIDG